MMGFPVYQTRNCPEKGRMYVSFVCTCEGCEKHRDDRYQQRMRELRIRDEYWTRLDEERKRSWKTQGKPI